MPFKRERRRKGMNEKQLYRCANTLNRKISERILQLRLLSRVKTQKQTQAAVLLNKLNKSSHVKHKHCVFYDFILPSNFIVHRIKSKCVKMMLKGRA